MDVCFDKSYCHLSFTQTHSQFRSLFKERIFHFKEIWLYKLIDTQCMFMHNFTGSYQCMEKLLKTKHQSVKYGLCWNLKLSAQTRFSQCVTHSGISLQGTKGSRKYAHRLRKQKQLKIKAKQPWRFCSEFCAYTANLVNKVGVRKLIHIVVMYGVLIHSWCH